MILSNDVLYAFHGINEIAERFNLTLEAMFYGDNAINFTLYALAPDDTQYAVCTTFQYSDFKPSANTTMLMVEPQATQEIMLTITLEEMQQEAEDSGWI